MSEHLRKWARDVARGARQCCSREFWLAVRDYYRTEAVAARLNAFAERLRERGQQ